MNDLTPSKNLTMSSREISELTGKEKKTIHRDIKVMCDQLYDDGTDLYHASKFGVLLKHDARGYCEMIYLDREHTDCLLTGYSAKARMKVIKRWHELENKQPQWMIELSPEAQIAIADLSKQRDNAIATKAQINDKRTATLMNKASQDSKRIKKLEAQVQNEGTHRSTLAAKLPVHIDVQGVSKSVSVILRNISEDMELPRKEVPCARYGKVWAYHVDVIAQFKEMYL